MYLHLGQNEIVLKSRIIGIFDLDTCSYEKRTREYLAAAEAEGVVLDISGDLPKSFVVCDHPYHEQIVYLCQLNTATLQKRIETMPGALPLDPSSFFLERKKEPKKELEQQCAKRIAD